MYDRQRADTRQRRLHVDPDEVPLADLHKTVPIDHSERILEDLVVETDTTTFDEAACVAP